MLVEFEPVIDTDVNARVLAVASALERRRPPGVRDVVPAYASLAVHLDPLRVDRDGLCEQLSALAEGAAGDAGPQPSEEVLIPVSYGGTNGPDLASVAAWAGITEAQVVTRHVGRTYRVFMIGFLPGFPYMGVVDPTIAMPRHDAPRARVPAGSVGIAGPQTGIYPVETPGGWRVIGRAACSLFDLCRERPSLLAPGQRVRFVPVDAADARMGGIATP